MSRLTEKQRKFVEEYMTHGNATEAAREAGYSSPASSAADNMQNPKILEAIDERAEEDPQIATRKERQQWWTSVMYDEEQRMRDRLKAAELLGKTQADFIERQHKTVEGSIEYELSFTRCEDD